MSLLFDTVVVLSNFHVPGAKLPNQHLHSGSTVPVHLSNFFTLKLILTVFISKDFFSLKLLVSYSKIYIYLPYLGKGLEELKACSFACILTQYPKGKTQSPVKQERKCNRLSSIRSNNLHYNKLIWFYIILCKKENHGSLKFVRRSLIYPWFLNYSLCIDIHTHRGKGLFLAALWIFDISGPLNKG